MSDKLKNVLIVIFIIAIIICGAFAIKRFSNKDIEAADQLANAVDNAVDNLGTDGVELYTNIFDKLKLNTKATGEVIVNNLGDTAMALKIENRCIKKFFNGSIMIYNKINSDDCTVATPSRCFEYENVDGGISINKYLCGSSFKGVDNAITYNADGEFMNVTIPQTIDNKKIVAISPFAFSPYIDKKGMDGSYILDTNKKIGIKYVEFLGNVNTIGTYAFSSNILEKIYIKDGLKNINSEAFSHNLISDTLVLSDTNEEVANYAFGDNNIIEFDLGKKTSKLGEGVLYNNNNLNKIKVNQKITSSSPYWSIIVTGQFGKDVSGINFVEE